MIKKYYTLLIASESEHINRSIRLSKLSMSLALLIMILITYFAYIGISLSIKSQDKTIQSSELQSFKSNVIDILSSQSFSEKSDSVILRNIQEMINKNGPNISMMTPVVGFVTQGIDTLKNHNGIDIISKKGDNIRSPLDGIVIFSGENNDLGNTLIISHSYDYFTVYGHCDSIFVKERDKVSKGSVLATLGESGVTTAPHLHFEVWFKNQIIDPRDIIKKYGELDVSTE